ncbi:MAG: GNAT family N-acetyltransferase [Clostridiales bacterium]|nr:GNAT family N-acetyltransferase [Clostridiales bacterium]
MSMKAVRAGTLAQRAGAYYVRIQAMARKYHITLEQEFDEHDTPDTRYIVFLDEDFPVATCRLYALDTDRVMLGRVVVLPEYRGRGLGRRAVLEAEQWARDLGFQRAVLESRVGKTGFYEKLGYTADESNVIVGETFTCIHMEKTL